MRVKRETAFVIARLSDNVNIVQRFLKSSRWPGRAYVKQLPILMNHTEYCYSEDVLCVEKNNLIIMRHTNSIIPCVLKNRTFGVEYWRNEST